MMKVNFYYCPICGNVVTMVQENGANPICCGSAMREIRPHTEEMLAEKHLPILKECCGKVKIQVGSVLHPMDEKHHIQWIGIETNLGYMQRYLKTGEDPEYGFKLQPGEEVLHIYAYCNLHGLWVSDFT